MKFKVGQLVKVVRVVDLIDDSVALEEAMEYIDKIGIITEIDNDEDDYPIYVKFFKNGGGFNFCSQELRVAGKTNPNSSIILAE